MRIVRTVAGLLLLTIGLPVLLVGGALWTAMQHRDSTGAFSASVEPVSTPGHAVLVTDIDTLLADDAPLARGADTRLRLSAEPGVFFGIAPLSDVAAFFGGAGYARVDGISLARGPLPMRTTDVTGTGTPTATPGTQSFWVRQGAGSLEWRPSDLRGQQLSLVVMNLDGRAGVTADLRAAVSLGWLAPSAYGLLALGWLMAILGIALLAWPVRPREVVFVVEPDQVPAVSARLGVTPLSGLGAPAAPSAPPPLWPVPSAPASVASARPVTLADALASAGVMAPGPAPAWPPFNPPPVSPTLTWPASRPVSPAGPPVVWPVPPDLPRDDLASRRAALAEAAGGRKMPVAGVSFDARPVSPAAPAAPAAAAPAPDAEAASAPKPAANADVAAAAPAKPGAASGAPAVPAQAAGAAKPVGAAPVDADAASAAEPAADVAAPAAKAAADAGKPATDAEPAGKPAADAEPAAQAATDAAPSAKAGADEAAGKAAKVDDKPSLAEALSGWSLPGKGDAEPAAKRSSLADLADAARRAARAVVSDGVTTLGQPEEPAGLAPRAKKNDAPARRPRKTAAGLPAPEPAAPTSLTLPKRPATRRRNTAPKQVTQTADETAQPSS